MKARPTLTRAHLVDGCRRAIRARDDDEAGYDPGLWPGECGTSCCTLGFALMAAGLWEQGDTNRGFTSNEVDLALPEAEGEAIRGLFRSAYRETPELILRELGEPC